MVTVVDVERGLVLNEIPVGVEPRDGHEPDGRYVSTPPRPRIMAHVIDTRQRRDRRPCPGRFRPRAALWEADGRPLLGLVGEIGGTLA
jgi:hypothetical protein